MKHSKTIILTILPVIAIFVLILDAKTSFVGAIRGIDICTKTIIPSLFPLFFLSGFIINCIGTIKTPKESILGRLCKIPAGSEPILILGLIGGYPVGAEAVSTAYHNGSISKQTAERMLGFCNNAGPAFIFGIAGNLFNNWYIPWIIWMIIILSSIITAMILPADGTETSVLNINAKRNPFDNALKATARVCGWVILFRVLITILQRWVLWLLPNRIEVLFTGFLELTNGCIELNSIDNSLFQLIAVTAFLSFGGLCVGLQTLTVTKGLSCKTYVWGKLLQVCIAISLSVLYIIIFNGIINNIAIIVLFMSIIMSITIGIILYKNNSGNYQLSVV